MHEKVWVHYAGDFYKDTPLGILLTNLSAPCDIENYFLAEKLLKRGVALPASLKLPVQFKSVENYFKYLVSHTRELFIILHKDPGMITKLDESKQTLLHHAIKFSVKAYTYQAQLILHLLLNAPGLKFSMQDRNGNTALHLAAALFPERSLYVTLLQTAKKSHFDFTIENNAGETVKMREKKYLPLYTIFNKNEIEQKKELSNQFSKSVN